MRVKENYFSFASEKIHRMCRREEFSTLLQLTIFCTPTKHTILLFLYYVRPCETKQHFMNLRCLETHRKIQTDKLNAICL